MSAQIGYTVKKGQAQEEPKELYLARFEGRATVTWEGHEEQKITLTSEILVGGEARQTGELLIQQVRRVSLVSEPSNRLEGIASLAGPANRIRLDPGLSGSIAEFDMRLYYSRLGIDPTCRDSDATYGRFEKLRGVLSWEPETPREGEPRVRLSIVLKDLVERHVGAIEAVELGWVVPFRRLEERPYDKRAANSLVLCAGSPPAGSTHDQRRLRIRVVNLSLVHASASVEPTVQELINGACKVWWKKGGIRIDPQPNILEPTSVEPGYTCPGGAGTDIFCVSLAKETDLPNEVPGVSPTPDYVDVYLVDQLTHRAGGGIAHGCASHDANVILEIQQAEHNRYLLAHELGHVLGLRHPGGSEGGQGCEASDLPEGSPCSVMVPHSPDSSRNTKDNFDGVDGAAPALGPSYGTIGNPPLNCGRDPDSPMGFFYIVRDFQYDDGTEPSVPEPPASDWWTYSDVWNSDQPPHPIYGGTYHSGDLSTPGEPIILGDHSPNHRAPRYAGPNYMYARVHTCQALTAPAQVYLYLAVPGVTSEPLRQLQHGGVPVIPLSCMPGMGAPKWMYTQWDVPAGYPSHCCVFAVVTGGDEPTPSQVKDIIDDPGSHNFRSLFSRLTTDNDVAQRNLHIETVSSTSGRSALPASHFENIFEEPADASIEIDARQALGVQAITVVGDEKELEKIEGHQLQRVRLSDSLRPGERLDVRLQVALPLQKSPGRVFPISLRFLLNDQLVSGFQHVIRVATLSEAALQTLDAVYGMLRDVAVAWDVDAARDLATEVQALVWAQRGDGPDGGEPGDWQAVLAGLADPLEAVSQSLAAIEGREPEFEAARERLDELVNIFTLSEAESAYLLVQQVRELAYRIQEPAGRVVRRKQ
jgi:hypothetical protein